jgi:hypothetical protein
MQEPSTELINDLNRQLDLSLNDTLGEEALESILAGWVEDRIHHDFQVLVQFLYRIDVSETRLRDLLEAGEGENAGRIIARLILERQRQKIETRKKFRSPGPSENEQDSDDPDMERL